MASDEKMSYEVGEQAISCLASFAFFFLMCFS